ncbi:MAG: DUF6599 family protein, partial [Candidatus Acidiferrum sp.]
LVNFAILATSILCVFAGCQTHSAIPTSLFPSSAEAPGWTQAPEVRTFSPDKLSDYIDGDAEKYLKAGVRSTSTADYKFKDQTQVTVDIYTMSHADGAKSIFDSEPAMDAQTPPLGDAARQYSQSLIFRRGRYLVRMVAYQDSPDLTQAMFNLGVAIEKKLPN